MIHNITDENFEAEVVRSEVPCVLEFTGAWCTICKLMEPVIEELSERYDGKVKFCLIDTDKERGLRIKFAVAALPYVVLVANGMKTPLFDELVSAERLAERIDFVLAGNPAPTTRPL